MGTNEFKPIQLALIGCGEVTRYKHLPALLKLQNIEIVGLIDIDQRQALQVAEQYKLPIRYTNLDGVLNDEKVEVVGVCVPAQHHLAVALPLIESGKHVLIEKPLALSLSDCDRLIQEARNTNKKVMMGFHMRFHRLVCEAKALIEQGLLGNLETIRAIWNSPRGDTNLPEWRRCRELGGGALVEIGVHHMDLWRYLTGTEVSEVFGYSRSGARDDESAALVARFENGMMGSGVFSERTSHEIELEICGDQGRLRLSCLKFDGLSFFTHRDIPGCIWTRLSQGFHTLKELPKGLMVMWRGGDYRDSYRREWLHFIESIRADSPVLCTLEEGHRALEIVLTAVEAIKLNRPIKVTQAPNTIQDFCHR